MNQLISHIEHLISRHDCVVIPSFGGFVANYESAKIDDVKGVVYPPSREISFNRSLTHNDGLLAHSVARKKRISYDSALALVNECVSILNFHLNTYGEAKIGRLGMLVAEKDGIIDFRRGSACSSLDFYSSLRPVAIERLPKAEAVSAVASLAGDSTVVSPRPSFARKFIRAAASLALLIGIGFTVSTTQDIDTSRLVSASVAPVKSEAFVLNTPPAIELIVAAPSAKEATSISNRKILPPPADFSTISLSVTNEFGRSNVTKRLEPDASQPSNGIASPNTSDIAASAEAVSADNNTHATITDTAADKHFLIVGSFDSMRRAKKYIASKNDSRLGVVKMGRHYRIYAAVGNSEEEVVALKENPDFNKKYPKAWPTSNE